MLSHQICIPSVWLRVLFLFCLLLFSCLPRRLLFCLTSCLLLNPFSAFVVSVSCSVLSGWFAGMLCWYFCGWLIVPGISIACHHCHWSPTDPLLYCCSASYIQLLQWNSFHHFPESSLVSGCPCFWWKPYSGSSWVLTQGSLLSGCFSRQSLEWQRTHRMVKKQCHRVVLWQPHVKSTFGPSPWIMHTSIDTVVNMFTTF